MGKAGKNIPESGAGSVPVRRPLVEWGKELGWDRLTGVLKSGHLKAEWYNHETGEFHPLPREHWQNAEQVRVAAGWGLQVGFGPMPMFAPSTGRQRSYQIFATEAPTASQPEQSAEQEQLEQPRRSSKRKQEEVLRRVRMAYPDGVEGVPTAEVFKQIRYSSWRTVNRALEREPLPKK